MKACKTNFAQEFSFNQRNLTNSFDLKKEL